MGLGFIGGFIRGLIVGGLVLVCVSLYLGSNTAATPERTEVEVPAGSEFNLKREDIAVKRPKPIEQTQTAPTPEVMQPNIETSLRESDGLTDAPLVPETGLVDPSAPSTPEVGLSAPIAPERPSLPTITSALPAKPQTETQSAAPSQPKIEQANAQSQLAPSLGSSQIIVPADPAAPELRRGQKSIPDEETAKSEAPSDQTPSADLGDVGVMEIETVAPFGKAIELYARESVFDDDKPRLSIVLLTESLNSVDPNLVEALPIPVSFAVDPTNPSAGALLSSLRELEQEAVILADLPPESSVQDVDVALTALVNFLPQTVGVIERQAGALQQSRDASLYIPEVLNRTGHGLIVYEKGLNTLAKESNKSGTPVATIYRDLDGDNQDERTIRRFMDGAAFRAANDTSEPIVVLARLRPATMSAILIWALQDRAQKTAVVPVSQLMKRE